MRAADKRRDNVFHPIGKKSKNHDTFVQLLYIFTSARLNWWPLEIHKQNLKKSQEDMQRGHPLLHCDEAPPKQVKIQHSGQVSQAVTSRR